MANTISNSGSIVLLLFYVVDCHFLLYNYTENQCVLSKLDKEHIPENPEPFRKPVCRSLFPEPLLVLNLLLFWEIRHLSYQGELLGQSVCNIRCSQYCCSSVRLLLVQKSLSYPLQAFLLHISSQLILFNAVSYRNWVKKEKLV